ncbi:hypothetical protein AB0L53_56520 [Nonomuraea sp. NPDC052129]|uniref:hypothetical protein n=1 Tax=Nonomuraea sp. NPDC052129 TaxID=3154651 RepID=UPI00343A2E9C
MRYEEPRVGRREDLAAALTKGDVDGICRALVSLSFYDTDWKWVEGACLSLLSNSDAAIRQVAATCLGHVARIHGRIDKDVVIPALMAMLDDEQVVGAAENALEDISIFVHE